MIVIHPCQLWSGVIGTPDVGRTVEPMAGQSKVRGFIVIGNCRAEHMPDAAPVVMGMWLRGVDSVDRCKRVAVRGCRRQGVVTWEPRREIGCVSQNTT